MSGHDQGSQTAVKVNMGWLWLAVGGLIILALAILLVAKNTDKSFDVLKSFGEANQLLANENERLAVENENLKNELAAVNNLAAGIMLRSAKKEEKGDGAAATGKTDESASAYISPVGH